MLPTLTVYRKIHLMCILSFAEFYIYVFATFLFVFVMLLYIVYVMFIYLFNFLPAEELRYFLIFGQCSTLSRFLCTMYKHGFVLVLTYSSSLVGFVSSHHVSFLLF